ncbi:MAG: aldo/keto reductase [Betaproteobacteria bacterium]|nr:aldo/keto reductase [Betaproteobacteria bacterium]
MIVATKFGQIKLEGRHGGRWPARVRAGCLRSEPAAPGLGVIDLLLHVHRIDPKVPIEDTWLGAIAPGRAGQKVRALRPCEANQATIRRAHQVHPLSAVQTEYSLLYREEAEET